MLVPNLVAYIQHQSIDSDPTPLQPRPKISPELRWWNKKWCILGILLHSHDWLCLINKYMLVTVYVCSLPWNVFYKKIHKHVCIYTSIYFGGVKMGFLDRKSHMFGLAAILDRGQVREISNGRKDLPLGYTKIAKQTSSEYISLLYMFIH